MQKKRVRGEKSVPCRARTPETLVTIPDVPLAGVYEYLNCGDVSATALFLSCHATAEAFQLVVHNETRVSAACRVDRCRNGGLQEIKWFPFGYFVSLYKVKFDVYVGQSSALGRRSRYDDIYCRRLILNTSEDLDLWMRAFVVLESAECLNGTWRSMLVSPEATEWGPTAVTIVGRKQGTYLARAGRRARGSRDVVQRTEVALLFLKYALFPLADSDQRAVSFLDGDVLVHVDMHHDVAPEFVETLRARCAELRVLHLRQAVLYLSLESTAAAIASASPLLETLRFSSWNTEVQLTDAFGAQLGRWCPLLRHVDLSHSEVPDATVVAISRGCPELQSLRLGGTCVTDAGLKAIGEGCRGLREFSLWGGTEAVTDSGLVSLSKGCFGLQKLTLGDLRGCSRQGLTAIARTCTQLTELDLTLNSVPFAAFAQGCPQLRSVRLTPVNATDLITIARGCPLLECIDVTGSNVTDASLLVVAECCPRLRELNVAYCQDVTSATVAVLTRRCINYSEGVTDATIAVLNRRCPNLRAVSVRSLY
jgi:hypothetical protein